MKNVVFSNVSNIGRYNNHCVYKNSFSVELVYCSKEQCIFAVCHVTVAPLLIKAYRTLASDLDCRL